MITVSIVEDDVYYRKAIVRSLECGEQFFVKGIYSDSETALKGLVYDRPDVAIVDVGMPGMTGIELIKKVKASLPSTQFLIHTVYNDHETIFNALQAGAFGYLLKNVSCELIAPAVIDLYNGGSPIRADIARKLIKELFSPAKPKNVYKLSVREHEVIYELAKGKLYKEIAAEINISPFTVKNHLKNIYRKMDVQNKVEALNKYKLFWMDIAS